MINYMRARQAVSIFCLILKKDFEEFMFYTKDGKLVTEMFTQGTPTDLIENVYNTYIIRKIETKTLMCKRFTTLAKSRSISTSNLIQIKQT